MHRNGRARALPAARAAQQASDVPRLERRSDLRLRPVHARTVSLGLWPWVSVAEQHGLGAAELGASVELSESQLRDPGQWIEQERANYLIGRVTQHVGLSAALLVARALPQGHFNLLELAMRSSATVGHATDVACRFLSLIHEGGALSTQPSRRGVRITWHPAGDPEPHPGFVEFLFASFALGARRETGIETLSAASVRFRHRGPRDRSLYWECFGCTPEFDSVDDSFELDPQTLATPLTRASESVHAQAAAVAFDLVQGK